MKTTSIHSLGLEMSMNNQCRLMTIGEHLRYGDTIDQKDDERRERSFKLDKWHEDMLKSFNKNLDKAIKTEDWEMVKDIRRKLSVFQKDYFSTRKTLQEEELYFEKLDDNLRIWLLEYIVSCIEKIKTESSSIDLRILSDNLKKKRSIQNKKEGEI